MLSPPVLTQLVVVIGISHIHPDNLDTATLPKWHKNLSSILVYVDVKHIDRTVEVLRVFGVAGDVYLGGD